MNKKAHFITFLLIPALIGCGSLSSTSLTVTGTVIYRQKIALPPDAVVAVTLADVSRADAPYIVIGQQVIETKGKQVPFPFAIPYDASKIDENHSYTVRATIKDGSGKLLFTSDTVMPVITRDSPTEDIEIVVVPTGG